MAADALAPLLVGATLIVIVIGSGIWMYRWQYRTDGFRTEIFELPLQDARRHRPRSCGRSRAHARSPSRARTWRGIGSYTGSITHVYECAYSHQR